MTNSSTSRIDDAENVIRNALECGATVTIKLTPRDLIGHEDEKARPDAPGLWAAPDGRILLWDGERGQWLQDADGEWLTELGTLEADEIAEFGPYARAGMERRDADDMRDHDERWRQGMLDASAIVRISGNDFARTCTDRHGRQTNAGGKLPPRESISAAVCAEWAAQNIERAAYGCRPPEAWSETRDDERDGAGSGIYAIARESLVVALSGALESMNLTLAPVGPADDGPTLEDIQAVADSIADGPLATPVPRRQTDKDRQ